MYGLKLLKTTETGVVLSGSLKNCRKVAAAMGLEVQSVEGPIISSVNGHAVHAPVDEKNPTLTWFKEGGLMLRGRDDYGLVIPLEIWNRKK